MPRQTPLNETPLTVNRRSLYSPSLFFSPTNSKKLLSPHLIPVHMRNEDFDLIEQAKPPVVKTVDASPDLLNRLYAMSPASLFFIRDWALSEQHDDLFSNPEATGKRHAQEMFDKVKNLSIPRNQVIVSGINEPRVWDNIDAVVRYYVAFCDQCTALGIKAAALNLSVGWPANNGGQTLPNWKPYYPVYEAIRRGNHVLCCHEYTDDKQGVNGMWGWWTGRTLTCPWDVPILIGEWGVDLYVSNPNVDKNARGWRPYLSVEDFWGLNLQYNTRMSADKRVIGICGFTSDGAKEWNSFDFLPVYSHWKTWAKEQPSKPDVVLPVPPVPDNAINNKLVHPCLGFPISQRFYQNPQNYAKFGLPGHNGTDFAVPLNTPLKAPASGTIEWVGYDESGYGNYVRLYSNTFSVHFFMAHFEKVVVQQGQTVQAGDVIGLCGSTGNSTGPHLHFEVRLGSQNTYSQLTPMNNGRVDPETWFAERNIKL